MEPIVYFYIRQAQPHRQCILVLFDTSTCFGRSLEPSSGRILVYKNNETGRGVCLEGEVTNRGLSPFHSFRELMPYLMMAAGKCRNM
jgi:hypothetical protein